ncbi:MAG: UDP-N-acetylglucosamine 1-carboxyvinyltransferase [bacterium]|nr:UDP-N-acetylglucosamine 1-carboxyvinyltransferase [bacterium]
MEKFLIRGGNRLEGEIDVMGAKNAAFPILAATILTKQDCIIKNLPLIEDVFRMLEILESMKAKVEWMGKRSVKINTKNLNPATINKEAMLRFRGSVLLYGPLLARFKKIYLPKPGGDIIGARPIDTHLDAFGQLGVVIRPMRQGFELKFSGKPKNKAVILNEFSVTGTENLLLFCASQSERIVIKIADMDYQVQELMLALKKMGAWIRVSGLHEITIEGKKSLKGFSHTIISDPIEAATFITMAIGTQGKVLVKNVPLKFLQFFFKKLKDFGAEFEVKEGRGGMGDVMVLPARNLKIDKIQSLIYPGIPSDLQSVLGVLATQTKGSTLLHDPLYEGRLKYLEELNKMGAEIYFTDPHRAIINGPTKLRGNDLGTFDLRGGAALIMAALMAEGKSTISNIYQVDRGYERIEERLQKLGADITRIS